MAAGREKYKKLYGIEWGGKNIWAGWLTSKPAEEVMKDVSSDEIIDYFFGPGTEFSMSRDWKDRPECPYAIYLDAIRFFMEKDTAKKNGILDEIRKKLSA